MPPRSLASPDFFPAEFPVRTETGSNVDRDLFESAAETAKQPSKVTVHRLCGISQAGFLEASYRNCYLTSPLSERTPASSAALYASIAHFACFADGLRSQPPIAYSPTVLAIPATFQ
jgi:hypothetical protein